jgi:hypothetical protein
MSVSEGRKRYDYKTYHVNLTSDLKTLKNIKIQPWTRVYELKLKLSKEFGIDNKHIRLFFCNTEMLDELSMLDYKVIDTKSKKVYLKILEPEIFFKIIDDISLDKYIQVYGTFSLFSLPNSLKEILEEVRYGLVQGLSPVLIPDGTSGTYMLRNANKETIALFKPIDEEAFAPNNQKGYTAKFGSETFRKGILSGEGSIREVAAYLLDKNNYFEVPETTFVEMSHPAYNKSCNELLSIEHDSVPKMRNSIIYNFVLENVVSENMLFNAKDNLRTKLDSTGSLTAVSTSSNNHHNPFPRKYGSLQRFIKSGGVVADFSYTLFDTR